MLQEVEKIGQLPAACQVEPAVSSSRSSNTTSLQPRRARWYSALQPTAPPPITTTRAWLFIYALANCPGPHAAPGCCQRSRRSLLHPRTRRIVKGPQRHSRADALVSDLDLVVARGNPLGAYRRGIVAEITQPERSAEGVAEHG